MSLTISDGVNVVTIRPFRVTVINSYATEFGLGYAVSIYPSPESVQYEFTTLVPLSDLQTLLNLSPEVTITNNNTTTVPEIPSTGSYILNRIEVRGERQYQNVREVSIKAVAVPP